MRTLRKCIVLGLFFFFSQYSDALGNGNFVRYEDGSISFDREEVNIDIAEWMKKADLSQKERSLICGEIYEKYERLPLLKAHVFRLGLSELPPWNEKVG